MTDDLIIPDPYEQIHGLTQPVAAGPLPQIDTSPEPIRLRGVGSTTIFGLNNRFSMDYPPRLTGKVAEEEFRKSVMRVNRILQSEVSQSFKWILFGLICCCCTAGLSLGPSLVLSKNTRSKVEKELEYDNIRLYHKIGLHWKLEKEAVEDSQLRQYVLVLEFLPKESILYPD